MTNDQAPMTNAFGVCKTSDRRWPFLRALRGSVVSIEKLRGELVRHLSGLP